MTYHDIQSISGADLDLNTTYVNKALYIIIAIAQWIPKSIFAQTLARFSAFCTLRMQSFMRTCIPHPRSQRERVARFCRWKHYFNFSFHLVLALAAVISLRLTSIFCRNFSTRVQKSTLFLYAPTVTFVRIRHPFHV